MSSLSASDSLTVKLEREQHQGWQLPVRVTMKLVICGILLKVIQCLICHGPQILLNHNYSKLSSLKMLCLLNEMETKKSLNGFSSFNASC